MRNLVLAQARANRGRYLASALAVLVAVAFVVTTLVLGDTLRSSIDESTAARYEGVPTVVSDNGSDAQPDELLAAVAVAPDVESVTLDVSGPVRIVDASGSTYGEAFSLAADENMRWQRLRDGRWPAGPHEVLVGSSSGRAIGDSMTVADVLDTTTPLPVEVVGIVDLEGSPLALYSGTIFAEPDAVRSWTGEILDWELRLDGETGSVEEVVAALGVDARVLSGEERATEVANAHVGDIMLLRSILLCFAAIAVVVAGLVIANTFVVLLAARTRELALMRCVGVTATQVRRSVRGEALLVGFVAATLGVLVGYGTAAVVVALARAADVPLPLTSVSVSATTIAVGLVVGTVVTVVAANGAARAATRVPALAALQPLETQPEPVSGSVVRRVCAALFGAAGAVLLTVGVLVANVLLACPGGLLLFVGVILASRRVVPAAVGAVGDLLARFGGPVAALAAGNARRNPRRTASTATALFIGVTLTSTLIVGTGTIKAGAPAIIDENFPVDISVQAPDVLPVDATNRFTTIDGVAAGTEIATGEVTIAGTEFSVLGVDARTAAATVRADLRLPEPGTIVLENSLASTLAVADGDTVTVEGATGARTLTVATSKVGEPDVMDLGDLNIVSATAAPDTVWLRLDAGLSDDELVAATDEISRVAATFLPGSDIVGAAESRQMLEKVLDTMLMIVGGLLSVAVVIALIGVGNTMALSVIERRRETAVLRAVGLSKAGVRSLLIREALIVAGVASVLGVVLGLVLGTAGTASVIGTSYVGLGSVPWWQLVVVVVTGGAAGVLASLIPARRASRVSPVAASVG